MINQKISFAFIHKNFRTFSFETKIIFWVNLATVVFCFFPWLSINPSYGEKFFLNAFSSPGFLIGTFIFLISLTIVFIFLDKICETKKIKLPLPETDFLTFAIIQQILFIVLAWSVLFSVGREYESATIRFGFFLIFLSQITAAVAVFLRKKNENQQSARNFLQHPEIKKETPKTEQINFLNNKKE
jgi:hypothetical protein